MGVGRREAATGAPDAGVEAGAVGGVVVGVPAASGVLEGEAGALRRAVVPPLGGVLARPWGTPPWGGRQAVNQSVTDYLLTSYPINYLLNQSINRQSILMNLSKRPKTSQPANQLNSYPTNHSRGKSHGCCTASRPAGAGAPHTRMRLPYRRRSDRNG